MQVADAPRSSTCNAPVSFPLKESETTNGCPSHKSNHKPQTTYPSIFPSGLRATYHAMASMAEQAPLTQERGQNSGQRQQGDSDGSRRWRGGGRGGSRNEGTQSAINGPLNGQGGGRGRGGRGSNTNGRARNQPPARREQPVPPLQPPPGLGGGGTFGVRPTKDAEPVEGEVASKQQDNAAAEEAVEDADVCFICASRVIHTAVAPCNHRTCHICALRLRALYKTRACAHCRVSLHRLYSILEC